MESSGFEADSGDLRIAMRLWATGVTVVTSEHNGERHGMTVSSFTSVSLEPPLVIVSLEKGTRTHELVEQSGAFGLTILSEKQKEISDRFAGFAPEPIDRFIGIEVFTLATRSPLVLHGLASFDCQLMASYDGGTHTIFMGKVLATQLGETSEPPLIYFDRGYRQLRLD